MKDWFEKKGLLQIDNQCGIQSKQKGGAAKKKKPSKQTFRVESIVPIRNQTGFKEYIKQIVALMGECYGIQRFRAEINDDRWVLVFKKKLVGFITIRNNLIYYVCVTKNYRRGGIAKEAIGAATRTAGISTLHVNNRDKNYKKLVRMYKSFGFVITKDDGRITTMNYSAE